MFTRSTQPALLGGLWNEMDRWFGDLLGDESWAPSLRDDRVSLPLNVWEDEEQYHVHAEVPGLDEKSLELEVLGDRLTISGDFGSEAPEGATYHRKERTSGKFTREVTLPGEIDSAKVTASLEDGVLTVALPKAAAAKPRRLTVKKAR